MNQAHGAVNQCRYTFSYAHNFPKTYTGLTTVNNPTALFQTQTKPVNVTGINAQNVWIKLKCMYKG